LDKLSHFPYFLLFLKFLIRLTFYLFLVVSVFTLASNFDFVIILLVLFCASIVFSSNKDLFPLPISSPSFHRSFSFDFISLLSISILFPCITAFDFISLRHWFRFRFLLSILFTLTLTHFLFCHRQVTTLIVPSQSKCDSYMWFLLLFRCSSLQLHLKFSAFKFVHLDSHSLPYFSFSIFICWNRNFISHT